MLRAPSSFARVLLVIGGLAQAQIAPHVIAPGNEALFSEMFGKGVELPGQCAWAGATIEETRVVSWYTCAGARFELELRHPSDGPESAAQTAKFVIRTRASAPPPLGLVEAIAGRVREREDAFTWLSGAEGVPVGVLAMPQEQRRTIVQWLAGLLAALAFIAWSSWWITRRWSLTPRATATSPLWVWPVSLGFGVAVYGVTRAFGKAIRVSLERDPGLPLAGAIVVMLLCAAVALCAAGLLAVLPSPVPRTARLLMGPAIFCVIGYPMSLVTPSEPTFGKVTPGRPNAVQVETRRDRPPVTYNTGPLGFRLPGWSSPKPAGTRRIALLGDSYVFGIGVEAGETLSAALTAELQKRSPGLAVEVVNLGIPGANLTTHVDVAEASASLELDAMVFCLTLPNDLSSWDGQRAHLETGRPGAFSVMRFLLGETAGVLWDLFGLERTTSSAGLAHLDHEVSRLAALREKSPHAPQLFFYAFRDFPTAVSTRLAATPGAHVIPEGESFEEDFLPGDGHPTATGNRRSASRIADALLQNSE